MTGSIPCLTALSVLILTGCTSNAVRVDPALMVVPPSGWPSDPGQKPSRKWNGTYQCMIDSMMAGQVTEAEPDIITRWGWPKREFWKKFRYWTVETTFNAKTPFGMAEARAKAFIRDNRVHFWLYSATDEIVP